MKELTEKQSEILGFISRYICDNGFPPSFREIGTAHGITTKGVSDHMHALRRKGAVIWRNGQPRTIKILERGQ